MNKYARSRNGALGQSVGTTIHQGLSGVPVIGPYIGATDSIGTLVGGGLGGAANLAAAITAAGTKTRDREAQKKYQQSRGQGVMNWLIPGMGQYNKWKSRGHMIRGEGYRDQEDFEKPQQTQDTKKKDKNKQVTKQANIKRIKRAYKSYYKQISL